MSNLVKQRPVATLTAAEAIVAAVLTFLVTHGVIGTVDVGQTTQVLAPLVALGLPAVAGAAKWALVTPVSKVQHILEQDGLLTDADAARLDAMLDAKLSHLLGVSPNLAVGELHPDAAEIGAPVTPTMAAGAPKDV